MTITRHLDTAIRWSENQFEDEFQIRTFHRSQTLGRILCGQLSLLTAMVFAWVLPDGRALLSFLAVLPFVGSELIANAWLTRRVPRPAPPRIPAPVIAVTGVLTVSWLAGIWRNGPISGADWLLGLIVGACAGLITLIVAGPRLIRRARRRDIRRIDARLGAD
ncbi:hypothetical protein M0E82_08280 [Corynebacterium sp. P7202]|uniref:Uncharacterized protein n=1 Tax=Corynebacterium pygosceleis TaxID=2800406 RepID=A0A9Q4C9C0_9CORY|nr:hypothetical protein [Corynebacterium pygosceleis]MCK7637990.1 hypothetical protein [Corynebacterium pygosceleis]MCX7468706.1 hypothetical protein [Corynebacterium pygosceleis]